MNAMQCYNTMLLDVINDGIGRASSDPNSPMREPTVEAEACQMYTLSQLTLNFPVFRPLSMRWAVANVLHFFAETEEAGMLEAYNPAACRFVEDGRLRGAYGPIAMPQVRECLRLLARSPASRRAIVSMGGFVGEGSINLPPCWSFLHFMMQEGRLHMVVYQRSLNLHGVMPYDCVLLTNLLTFAAIELSCEIGSLQWIVGSLHMPARIAPAFALSCESVYVPYGVLCDPIKCLTMLKEGISDAR